VSSDREGPERGLRGRLDELRRAVADDEVRAISRRYLVSNGFDGALTSIGVAVGSFLSGVPTGTAIVKIGLGAAVGLATSGVWSVWEIERAEKRAELATVERAMLRDLSGTRLGREQRAARTVNAVASGLGPVAGVLLPVSPYLLAPTIGLLWATVAAVGVGVAVLFAFGSYVGATAGLNPIVAGARMGLAGLVVAAVNYLLPG
jgi:predicted membrane protein (TIGR00267 family)